MAPTVTSFEYASAQVPIGGLSSAPQYVQEVVMAPQYAPTVTQEVFMAPQYAPSMVQEVVMAPQYTPTVMQEFVMAPQYAAPAPVVGYVEEVYYPSGVVQEVVMAPQYGTSTRMIPAPLVQEFMPVQPRAAMQSTSNLIGMGRLAEERYISVQDLASQGRFLQAEPEYPPGFLERFGRINIPQYQPPQPQPQPGPSPYYHGGNYNQTPAMQNMSLIVKVQRATHLANADNSFFGGGKSDPYVVLHLVDARGKDVTGAAQTTVKNDTLNPVWNEDIVFEGLDNPADYTLRMNIFDKDTFLGTGHLDWLSKDDQIGDGTIRLREIRTPERFLDQALDITANLKKKVTSKLFVSIMLTSQPYEHHTQPAPQPDPTPYAPEPQPNYPPEPQPQFNLVLKVKNATGLRNADGMFAGKSDPYVVVHLVDGNGKDVGGKPQQTTCKEDTLDPVWNEDIVFNGLEDPHAYTLRMNVFDKDTFLGSGHFDWLSKDDQLGDGKIPLNKISHTEQFLDERLKVDAKMKGKAQGMLNCSVMLTEQPYRPTHDQNAVIAAHNKPSSKPSQTGPKLNVVVKVLNAKSLRNADGMMAGVSDPYVVVHLVDTRGKDVKGVKPQQTKVIQNNLNPEWNEDIVFEGVENPQAYTVRMNVFDQDTFMGTGHLDWLSKDDQLGDGKVNLGTIRTLERFQDAELMIDANLKSKTKAKLSCSIMITSRPYTPQPPQPNQAIPSQPQQQPSGGYHQQPAKPSQPVPKKNLVVKVKNASDLRNADGMMAGVSDPYVVLHLVDGRGKEAYKAQQTSVVNDNLNPVWNEDIVFTDVENPAALSLRMNIFDQDTFMGSGHFDWLSKDDQLGDAKISLNELRSSESTWKDMTFTVAKQKVNAKLNVALMLTSQNYQPQKPSQTTTNKRGTNNFKIDAQAVIATERMQNLAQNNQPSQNILPAGSNKRPSATGGAAKTLVVKVKRATGLRNTDGMFAGKSDPYVVLHLCDAAGKDIPGIKPKQTKVINDDLNPVWNEEVTFDNLQDPRSYTLRMNVFDSDTFMGTGHLDWLSKDDALGDAKVTLSTLRNTGYGFKDMDFMIEANMKSKTQAKLYVGLSTRGEWGA
jgi:hypothetical protein